MRKGLRCLKTSITQSIPKYLKSIIDSVEKLIINEEDLQAFEAVHFEPIQLKENEFVPDFGKDCEENFTREKQMMVAAYSTYPTLIPAADKLEYNEPKSLWSNPDLMQEHAVSQRGCNLIERLELDMELPNAQIQEECSVVKISVVEEEEKKQVSILKCP